MISNKCLILAGVTNDSGFGDLSPVEAGAIARPKQRTDDSDLSSGKDRFASPGGYSPFRSQFGGSGSPGGWSGVDDMRTDKTWSTPPSTSFQDWMSSSHRRVGPAATSELNQMFSDLSDLSLEHNWSSLSDSWKQSSDGRAPSSTCGPLQVDLQQSKVKPSLVATDTGYHERPPARHVIGSSHMMPPVFPLVGTSPKSSSKESQKEAYERLTAEQARQQYLSRILAMQLGAGHPSPGSAAPRLPGPFWSSQHPAVFACEPTLGNSAFMAAGKVPLLIGPAGPVAYDISTMSAFGVPQLVPTFRAFR